jgi:hypothetical protein
MTLRALRVEGVDEDMLATLLAPYLEAAVEREHWGKILWIPVETN